MLQYSTTRDHDQHVRLIPTKAMRAGEFLRGFIKAMPISACVVLALFGVDLLGAADRAPHRVLGIVATMSVLALVCAVSYGVYRSFRVMFWELDARRNIIRFQTRSWSGAEGLCYESSLSHVKWIELSPNAQTPRALSIHIEGAPPLDIARNWARVEPTFIPLYNELQALIQAAEESPSQATSPSDS